jgi:hypothetical protein
MVGGKEMKYIRIDLGTGFYWMDTYIVKSEDDRLYAQAAFDALCDYLEKNNEHNHIFEMTDEYKWDENGENILNAKTNEIEHYRDEFLEGGNTGVIVMHYGAFMVSEPTEEEVNEIIKKRNRVTVIDFDE